jgi:hypothetical protein
MIDVEPPIVSNEQLQCCIVDLVAASMEMRCVAFELIGALIGAQSSAAAIVVECFHSTLRCSIATIDALLDNRRLQNDTTNHSGDVYRALIACFVTARRLISADFQRK